MSATNGNEFDRKIVKRMGKRKIIIVLCLLSLFVKCTCSSNNENNEDILTLKFDFDKDPVNIYSTGLISKVEVFNLDCEEAIIGQIDKIIKHKNRIYLLDIWQTHSVFIYDTAGNFVRVIDDQGQGPDEYVQLLDLFINHEDETLNLVSRIDKKILKYDLEGNFITTAKMPQMFYQMSKVKNGYIGYKANFIDNTDNPYNLWTLSNTMEIKEGFFEIDPTWNGISSAGLVFSSYEDKIYYITPMDFNVYCLEDDVFSVAYTFDFGKCTWPEEYREFDKYEKLYEVNMGHHSYIYEIDNFQETKNHLIANVIHKGQTRLCIYNKQTGQTYIAEPDMYKDGLLVPFGLIKSIDENAIYTLIDASHIKMYHNGRNDYVDFEAKYPEQIKRLREKFPHVDEEGNPFLAIFYIK
jgi:hypothetical protein